MPRTKGQTIDQLITRAEHFAEESMTEDPQLSLEYAGTSIAMSLAAIARLMRDEQKAKSTATPG